MKPQNLICIILPVVLLFSCNAEEKKEEPTTKQPGIKTEIAKYSSDTVTMNGYVAYDSGSTGKRPVVMIIHEWWGLNDYTRQRARQIAELGYVAFAVDMFGNGKTVESPSEALAMVEPLYGNTELIKTRFNAALAKAKMYGEVDTSRIAAIGYCFGGALALANARMGADLDGVVSFHGSLLLGPANKDMKSKVLVLHGGADPMVPPAEVAQFRKQMDSLGVDYKFVEYPGALHAFTNPAATEKGKTYNIPVAYDAKADSASWNEMKIFLNDVLR